MGLGVWGSGGLAVWVRVRPWVNRWPSSAAIIRGEVAQQQQSGGQVSRAADAGHEFMSPRPCLQMRSRWMEAAALPCQPMPTHAASPLLSCDPSPYSIKCPTWDLGAAPLGPQPRRALSGSPERSFKNRHVARLPRRQPTTRSTGGWSLAWATAARRQCSA